MALLFTVALLMTAVSAQLTTSVWLPGSANANQTYVGSVVSLHNDHTILSLRFDGEAIEKEYYGSGPGLATVGGTTFMAYEASAYQPPYSPELSSDSESSNRPAAPSNSRFAQSDIAATVRLECTRASSGAVPACTTTVQGYDAINSILEPGSGIVQTTMTTTGVFQQFYENDYKLVITAGLEKLSASVAATPAANTISSTKTQASTGKSQLEPAQATGAAVSMRSMKPVLAGLGAAAVFFV